MAIDDVRPPDGRDDALGDHVEVRNDQFLARLKQNAEFVAAKTRNHVRFAHALAQSLRDPAQKLVADRMTKRIVDFLEQIEIDDQNCERFAALIDPIEVARQSLLKL